MKCVREGRKGERENHLAICFVITLIHFLFNNWNQPAIKTYSRREIDDGHTNYDTYTAVSAAKYKNTMSENRTRKKRNLIEIDVFKMLFTFFFIFEILWGRCVLNFILQLLDRFCLRTALDNLLNVGVPFTMYILSRDFGFHQIKIHLKHSNMSDFRSPANYSIQY